jgi:hypothetical protein
MAKDTNFIRAYSDYHVYTAALSAAVPSGLALPTQAAGWYETGYISDNPITEGHTYNEVKIFDLVGRLMRVLRNQEERPWAFECLQLDAVVAGLMYPGTAVVTTGATAEVQTITMTATGGSWAPSLAGFPAVTPGLFNVSTANLQTALREAWDLNVTVTGTAGTSYVVTFPAAEGDIPTMTLALGSTLTGGTATVAVTTPGVTGVNTRAVGAGTQRNFRQFIVDAYDATIQKRALIQLGEAVWTGTVDISGSNAQKAQFTLNTFPDAAGNNYYLIDNDSAMGLAFA